MKLDAKQVRFRQSMLAGLSRSRLSFSRTRTSIHLQETAMVVEGEMLQFHFLGIERFFARAVSEYATVTVPYSRMERVKFDRKWLVRGVLLLIAAGFALVTIPAQFTNVQPAGMTAAITATALIWSLIAVVTWLAFWTVPPTYTVTYRNPNGAKRKFIFYIRSKPVRKRFDTELAKYRAAGKKFSGEGPA